MLLKSSGRPATTPPVRKRHFLASEGAAEMILFDVAPIGGEYPTLQDGASWLALWERYDPVDLESGFVLLARRQKPRTVEVQLVAPQGVDRQAADDAGRTRRRAG